MRTLQLMALPLAMSMLAPLGAHAVAGHAAVLHAQEDSARARGADKTAKAKKAGGGGDGASDQEKQAKPKARDRSTIIKDSVEAEQRPLFASHEPLPFTLIADFGAIGKNRDSTHTERYGGTLIVKDSEGVDRRIPVQLRTRGHFRLKRSTCSFVNVLVRFPSKGKDTKGTPFEGQKSLKLGAHCQDDHRYERILRREHLAYRIMNTVTPRSFRTRLSTATYIDSVKNKELGTRLAMWIEDEDDMAARQGAKLREFKRALFDDMHPATLDQMAIFEYLIGNTDWSIYALHNIRLAVTDSSVVYPIAYDFDFSGLVDAPYATPAPQLNIRSVRDRLYRGPCRTWEEVAPSVARFLAHQDAIMALADETPRLEGADAHDVRRYLEVFFDTARDPRQAKRAFVDGCLNKPGA